MILVDTSVWIGLLNGRLGTGLSADGLLEFVTSDPIVQEVVKTIARYTSLEATDRFAPR